MIFIEIKTGELIRITGFDSIVENIFYEAKYYMGNDLYIRLGKEVEFLGFL